MIHGVFGKLGAGKGLYVMDIIARELLDGFRDVVTNVPLRLMPWVNGQGIPQLGLKAYLQEKLYPLSEDEIDDILKRVRIEEDIEQGHDLFLWRRDGETGEWFKMEVTKKDEKGRPERFNPQEAKLRHCAPCLVVTDEAWAFYPNNGGWSRAPVLGFYGRQQRKLRDEWYIVTQHPTDCDEVFWKIAQDFHVCRNHGMERMGFFRQPEMFRVIVYSTNPAKGNAQRQYEIYRRLDKKLCQCYDTTAGVGIGGGFQGDSNQKKPGFHLAWLLVLIAVGVVGLASVPWLMGKATRPFLSRTMGGGSIPPPPSPASTPLQQTPQLTPVNTGALSPANSLTNEPELFCTGYTLIGGKPRVFLSDGSICEEDEVTQIAKKTVTVNGRKLKIVVGQSWSDYQPPQVSGELPVSLPPSRPVNQADVTVIGGNRRQPPVRIGSGMASMQRNSPQGSSGSSW